MKGVEQTTDRTEVEIICGAIHTLDEPIEVRSDNEYAVNDFLKMIPGEWP